MPKSTLQRLITVMIFAAMALAIGCGDGGKRSTNLRRDLPNTNPAAKPGQGKIVPGAQPGAGVAGAQGGSGGAGAGAAGGQSGSNANGQGQIPTLTPNAQQVEIAAKIEQAKQLLLNQTQEIDLANVPKGEFTLENFATSFKLQGTNPIGETFSSHAVRGGALNEKGEESLGYGVDPNASDKERLIEVPLTLTIPLQPTNGQDLMKIGMLSMTEGNSLKSTVKMGGISRSISKDLTLIDLLASRTSKDANGLQITTKANVRPDGSLVLSVEVLNELQTIQNPGTKDSSTKIRMIYLTYKAKAPAPTSAEGTPASTPSAPVN